MRAKTTGKMIGGGILLLILLCGLSACIGSYPLSLPDILRVISGNAAGEMGEKVFFTLRLPRVLMGVTAGASLGLCGGVFQLLFRNPLASPDLVGVASGAGAGAACGIVLGTGSMAMVMGGAFWGISSGMAERKQPPRQLHFRGNTDFRAGGRGDYAVKARSGLGREAGGH